VAADLAPDGSAAVTGPYGEPVAGSWDSMFEGVLLTQTLARGGVLPPGSDFWTGATPAGRLGANCNDWQSSGATCALPAAPD